MAIVIGTIVIAVAMLIKLASNNSRTSYNTSNKDDTAVIAPGELHWPSTCSGGFGAPRGGH